MSWYEIIEQDIVQWLQEYEGERFHAILSDPPYALISVTKRFGKENSAPAQEGADGRFSRLSGGFMGQTWDGFASLDHYREWVKTWAKLLIEKALYPGSVCLFFGGTRTWHHLALGLEQGGFEVYDTLLWLYGSGFPKSHSISKQIDRVAPRRGMFDAFAKHFADCRKKSGMTQKEIAEQFPSKTGGLTGCVWNWENAANVPTPEQWNILQPMLKLSDDYLPLIKRIKAEREVVGSKTQGKLAIAPGQQMDRSSIELDITVPATEAAKQWEGYGTALKPAWESILLCRVPRKGATFASLALEYGSGALNIDGARISTEGERPARVSENHELDRSCYEGGAATQGGSRAVGMTSQGRWPANLLLSHHEDCQKIDEIEIEGRTINRWQTGMKPFGDGAGDDYESEQLPPETVERWACVSECPIRQLDDQAGIRPSATSPSSAKPISIFRPNQGEYMPQGPIYPDTGGPSRFFYCGKASRREKDKGLEEFYWKRTGKGFEQVDQEVWATLERRERAKGCIHPTVKPLGVCRYISKLILPPQQEGKTRRILIPFSGSGSEIIAARQAGWDLVVGIEMKALYNELAHARINANIGMF